MLVPVLVAIVRVRDVELLVVVVFKKERTYLSKSVQMMFYVLAMYLPIIFTRILDFLT